MQPRYHPSLDREEVVQFAMCCFDIPREEATKCVRKTFWGYRVLNPTLLNPHVIPYGEGPIVVHGDTGVFVLLSSNPHDMFGPYGYTTLKSVEDVDAMIEDRRITRFQTIHRFIKNCEDFHTESGMPHVHN